eukprot:Nk52_evm62s1073 gene=Nk52_evmTU62s1073
MECSHLAESVDLEKVWSSLYAVSSSVARLLSDGKKGGFADIPASFEKSDNSFDFAAAVDALKSEMKCAECDVKDSVWLCLSCGHIGCGRYDRAHALAHFKETNHAIVANIKNDVYNCYRCDEFIELSSLSETNPKLVSKICCILGQSVGKGDSSSCTSSVSARNQSSESSSSSVATKKKGGGIPGAVKKLKLDMANRPGKLLGGQGFAAHGLYNLGNTCFMNAVLQGLYCIDEFREYVTELPSIKYIGTKTTPSKHGYSTRSAGFSSEQVCLIEELRELFCMMACKTGNADAVVDPTAFFCALRQLVPRFRGFQQHDSHECLRCIFERFLLELKSPDYGISGGGGSPTSSISNKVDRVDCASSASSTETLTVDSPPLTPSLDKGHLQKLFEGSLLSEVTCLTCKKTSKKSDTFLDVSLDIVNNSGKKGGKQNISRRGYQSVCTLEECLEAFTSVESLVNSELYMCDSCGGRQPSTKRFLFEKLPKILCIHLKRFRWSAFTRVKINSGVEFKPEELDMAPFVTVDCPNKKSSIYDLVSLVVHHGSGAGSGHYTCFGKLRSWYHFNDNSITNSREGKVVEQKAYILFYARRE